MSFPLLVWAVTWAHTYLESALQLRPFAHLTVETFLNVLWVLVALGGLVHWAAPDGSRRRKGLARLVPLLFALCLLFPVISANDDLAQQELINDASFSQSLQVAAKSDKRTTPAVTILAEVLTNPLVPPQASPQALFGRVASAPADSHARQATGNHSPPLC